MEQEARRLGAKDISGVIFLTLADIRREMDDCQTCGLGRGRRNLVFGEGDEAARLMLIGEGPGADEDRLGRPFVGAAGQLLDRILAAVDITREEVYIANVVKCRPPGNRTPSPAEAGACLPWLFRQLETIRPAVIVLLGATAFKYLIGGTTGITVVRGKWLTTKSGIAVMPTYHPAALLRNPGWKKPVWEDFQQVRDRYNDVIDPTPKGGGLRRKLQGPAS